MAALLASVVDQPKAVNQIFNCATDRCVHILVYLYLDIGAVHVWNRWLRSNSSRRCPKVRSDHDPCMLNKQNHSYVTFKEVVRLAGQAAGKANAKDKIVIYDPSKKKVCVYIYVYYVCMYIYMCVCVSPSLSSICDL